jgi:YHS domain-containing protein
VVSGNFLIDSESRLKQASAGIFGKPGRDSVCGMALDEDRAKAAGLTRKYGGKSFYFCAPEDMAKFDKSPQKYATSTGAVEPMTMPQSSGSMPMGHGGDGKKSMPALKGSATTGAGDGSMPMSEWRHDGMIMMPGNNGPSRFEKNMGEVHTDMERDPDDAAPKQKKKSSPGSGVGNGSKSAPAAGGIPGTMPMEGGAGQMPVPDAAKVAPSSVPPTPKSPAAPASNLDSIMEQYNNAK